MAIIIRIRQKGYIRTRGYQTVQWAVTVPVSDPPTDPLISTAPISYAPLFVVRKEANRDYFERVADLRDLADYPTAELRFFDLRGPNGDAFFAPIDLLNGPIGPFAGDILEFPDTANSLSYWLEDTLPYTTNTFVVKRMVVRAQGSAPQLLTSRRIQLPGYTFTPDDISRWVHLSGFATPGNNGFVQILEYTGNTAVINRTVLANETGGTWQFPYVEIETFPNTAVEPRYFPTRETNLRWMLKRGVNLVAQGNGGATMRDNESVIIRTTRLTTVSPSLDAGLNLMSVVRNGAANLQRAAESNNTNFTPLITSTYGP